MNLKSYFLQYPRNKRNEARDVVAKALGVTRSAIVLWEHKHRLPTPKYAIMIDEITGGIVAKVDLRPDLFDTEFIKRGNMFE